MKKVIVTSQNPIKLTATIEGFKIMFPHEDFEFQSFSSPSGVSDQPLTSEETFRGAFNRVHHAIKNCSGDFFVGLEGGVEMINGTMESFAWIYIKSEQTEGKGKTGTLILPNTIRDLVVSGKELGEADDIVFGFTNSKQQMGAVGLLTKGSIDRTAFYSHGVVLALIPFCNTELY